MRLTAWGVVALAVAVIRNQLWASPNLAFFTAISTHLGSNPFGHGVDGDYLLTNLLGPTIARALGQTQPHEYARLHVVLLVVGLALVVAAVYRRFGYSPARLLCILLAAAPVTTVAMEWLGQPDALTLPLALGIVIARRRTSVALLAVLIGLNHAEQGVMIAGIGAVVATVIGDEPGTETTADARGFARRALPHLATMLGGVVVGRLLVEAYLRLEDIVVTKPRTAYLDLGVSGFVHHHLQSPWLLYSLLGPLWALAIVVAVRCLRRDPAMERRSWGLLGIALAAAVLPMLVTLDETRVYGLITAPVLVGAAVLASRATWPAWLASPRLLLVGTVLLAAAPGMFNAGESYWAPALHPREFARFLVDGSHPGDLTTWLLQPFGFRVPTAK
ncbi:MAG: hypothetical protein U0Q22_05630 [Acidimicrobiales bacterium]